jgi:integrase
LIIHQERRITFLLYKFKCNVADFLGRAIERWQRDWIETTVPELGEKLAKRGLFIMPAKHTLKKLWDTYLDQRADKKETTLKTYLATRQRFFSFFTDEDELITTLTRDRIEQWKQFLLGSGKYATATVAGTINKCKAAFNWAKRQKWITDSPLDGVDRGSDRNKANDRYITPSEYRRLLEACPDQEWRVILALARVGGLHPNEILTLKWSDIDWERNRFKVYNSKVEYHSDLYVREVPLFTDLVVELDKLRSMLGSEDQEFVINRIINRQSKYPINGLGQRLITIAKKAGIGVIPRPFDNARASAATEIERQYGAMRESAWLGHSEQMARKCYLMVLDDDFAETAGKKVVVKDAIRYLPENTEGEIGAVLSKALRCKDNIDSIL